MSRRYAGSDPNWRDEVGIRAFVGSSNETKIAATDTGIRNFMVSRNAPTPLEVISVAGIDSGVSRQPMSLGETFCGAKRRAIEALRIGRRGVRLGGVASTTLGIGLESGLLGLPSTMSLGNVGVCCITDGKGPVVFATSPIWEVPEKVRKELILGRDLSEAGEAAGVLKEASEGHRTGIIDVLSRGYYNRENYLASAVFLALLSFFQEDVIT